MAYKLPRGIMKKTMITILLLTICAMDLDAQVVFSKFKFNKDSPLGCCPTRKMTDTKFKVTADKAIKTMKVHYSGVDQVNDAVCSDIVGGVNANVKHTKYKIINITGPFEPGKTYSRWASATFYYPQKVTAFPRSIEIDYMDRTSDTITITKDNLAEFFPKLKWIDVDYEHGFQPSN